MTNKEMTKEELKAKSTCMRKIVVTKADFLGKKKVYGDIEYYFDENDVEIGYYNPISDIVVVFDTPREWDEYIKSQHEIVWSAKEDEFKI